MTTLTLPRQPAQGMTRDERRVIFASSLGTVFEWYDFYLYATLAPFFAALFFPPGNDTAALLSAFATYAAGSWCGRALFQGVAVEKPLNSFRGSFRNFLGKEMVDIAWSVTDMERTFSRACRGPFLRRQSI
jgi:hypothetical protein